ncbi:hypothetical protein HDE78_001501 [Rhodanobacter sp. K2T2]|uniref:MobA/MobL family protein n=1 Tax=Rhodanobacter sp. K2T2 TaxID=2723085 RepID=UPI0015CE5528|nr:MobA/MobL family protein [Rhodanobacter sp. K2T2]NYE28549.1 hypothetical protein [Rhodanobacter sp. K2T2]
MQHARPHLQTHRRAQGHSAVAGAAYRLGLRLYDERTKIWHDYRKRKLGEEIVAALTLAPEGAPDWATDPGQLWNRAEAAELRKDSQVARDYRIPVPLGLSDDRAAEMAKRMAQFIVDELHTAVSIGLHRDADVDALGAVKPKQKQGYHAHIYFPTRRLEQLEKEDGDGTTKSDWGLHTKFAFLTGRRSSSDFVERLNERWANLANEFTAANDLPADYTHLSYVRQDLPITPQPTLGAAVVAMERSGFFTRKGNAVRDIILPSALYEATHAVVVDAQRQRAVDDAIRERTDPAARAARLAAEASHGTAAPLQSEGVTTGPLVQAPLAKPPLTAPPGSLVARFHAAAPAPNTLEERQLFVRVLKIVALVERVLAALGDLANRFQKHAEDQGRRMAAKLDMDYQLDGCRDQRAAAKEKLEQWEANHKWQVATARAFGGGEGGRSKAWQSLIDAFEGSQRRMQTLKAALRSHQVHLDTFAVEKATLKAEQSDANERLRTALASIVAMSPGAAAPLLDVSQTMECEWIKAAMPEMTAGSEVGANDPEIGGEIARLRPSSRRSVGSP